MPAADDDTLLPFSLPNICKKKVTAAFDGGTISSDGGVFLGQRQLSGESSSRSDVMVECFRYDVACHLEAATQIIPDRDAKFVAGLGQAEECIAAVSANIGPCSAADLQPRG